MERNIYTLPTEAPTRGLVYFNGTYRVEKGLSNYPKEIYPSAKGYEVYIISDKEPKLDEWGINLKNCVVYKCKGFSSTKETQEYHKKIILTTDFRLAPDVQKIDDKFLEWFAKNPSCDNVEVDEEFLKLVYNPNYVNHTPDGDGVYLTPKSEDLQYGETILEEDVINYKIDIPKVEVLKEAAEEYASGRCSAKVMHRALTDAIKFGAKWQQERSYSEEDMRDMYNKSCGLWGLGELSDQTENNERFKSLLRQVKKNRDGK